MITNPPEDMVLRDSIVYVAMYGGLQIVNVARPREPEMIGSCGGISPRNLAVVGSTAYVTMGSGGLLTIDVSDPTEPQVMGIWRGRSSGIAVVDTLAFVTGPYTGIVSLSVANPAVPYVLDSLHLTDTLWWNDVVVMDTLAYVAGERIWAVDVSDPRNLRLVPRVSWTPPYLVNRLVHTAPYLYAVCYNAGVSVLEVMPTGIAERGGLSITREMKVVPNPTHGRLMVWSGGEVHSWTMRDVAGRLVGTGEVRPAQRTLMLDLKGWPAGVYVLEVHTGAGDIRGKVVKQ